MLEDPAVAATILVPLSRSGLPRLDRATFSYCLAYFGLIGLGFMFVQIPLMQRFAVYLGHPAYTIAVILCSMILASGIGSALSDRIDLDRGPGWLRLLPLSTVALLAIAITCIQPLIDHTIHLRGVTFGYGATLLAFIRSGARWRTAAW